MKEVVAPVHTSVMKTQALRYWLGDLDQLQSNQVFVDATYGRGGHSQAFLKMVQGKDLGLALMVIDKDPEAIAHARSQCAAQAEKAGVQLQVAHASFANASELVKVQGWQGSVQGILLDLGVSSPQLDQAERGFSFLKDGPLDMRMDTSRGLAASEWLAQATEAEIRQVLWDYGEERQARAIARAIVAEREQGRPINTTLQLANLVANWVRTPRQQKSFKHPATRTFQAIRIQVNQELEDLKLFLSQVLDTLAVGGRLVVISFHSLEDRLVKRFLRDEAKGDPYPRDFPIQHEALNPRLKLMSKGLKPGSKEVVENPRARSAVMRVAEKLC